MSVHHQIKLFPLVIFAIALLMGVDISLSTVEKPGSLKRTPSSQITRVQNQFSQIDIGCSGISKTFKTTSDQIRLRGCLGGLGTPVRIINMTTGLELTVLENEELFTTDYFRLQKEENRLQVTYQNDLSVTIPIFYSAKSKP